MGDVEYVTSTEVWTAIRAIEAEHAAGTISTADAERRIDQCRRAVTRRDLWKASGGKAGSLHGGRRHTTRLGSLAGAVVDGLQSLIRW
ncbi:MAG TPA: hypothetical protein VMU51_21455 [Mycobacteriales bacterium]|nr:hypothetical protein [Mycobacteriales bacterium]